MDRESNHESSSVELAKEQVYACFEAEWRKDSSYQVDDILPLIYELVLPFNVDSNQPGFFDETKAELIKIEMDLKHAAKIQIDRFEYYRRFPDFVTVIDQSLARLAELSSEGLREVQVTVSIVNRPETDGSKKFEVDEKGKQKIPSELGPFENITQIGKGGFGIVCSALDSRDGRLVALKFPRQRVLANNRYLEMFLEEADRVMKLDHPGIVKTFSVGPIDGFLVIVQQLIVGTDLEKSLGLARTHKQIAELVALIGDALAYANHQRIVHRDLKPANIMLDSQGRPYITDFGMALDENDQLAAPNTRCGTPSYMCPQLVAGLTRNLDGRADIWSLGVILYELLAQQRPFRGNTDPEIFQHIETCDPRPLRQIDSKIPPELQRICLKCLERAPRYRYLTADELADDLRYWIAQSESEGPAAEESETKEEAVFVPKGLRSYGADDADFFLQLLPGPRDRDNIPASIRFWSSRICEPVPEENRVPVGVIYGPSGSGKSSFVKAGLLPRLNHQIEAIYVESTQADTEVRLIKALRNRFPEIPTDVALPEILRGLSHGEWGSSGKKIFVVLDQFEQRLSQADDYDQSQMAKALRHCDSQQLQCLLLIRDDFWLALTRFADALEMDLLEGQNSQSIDLFDREHARKVLIKLGRAYECLPTRSVDLNKDQLAFIDKAVDQLAVGNFVICVRLTLFAEMCKSRPWTETELESVGGAHGIGQRFLEETFGAGSVMRRYQLQSDQAKAVLESLLPVLGSDIRGSMRPESALMEDAKLEKRQDKFKDLISTLDQELRLITRTDPDVSGEIVGGNDESSSAPAIYYQLTHDYLVSSVRDWLESDLKKSWVGRREIRFKDLESLHSKDKNIWPTLFEFGSFLIAVRGTVRLQHKGFWQKSRTHFIKQLAIVSVILSVLGVLAWKGFDSYHNSIAQQRLDSALECDSQAFPIALDRLAPYASRIQLLNDADKLTEPRKRFRSQLIKVVSGEFDETNLNEIVQGIDNCPNLECGNITTVCRNVDSGRQKLISKLIDKFTSSPISQKYKVRLSITLLTLGDETATNEIFSTQQNPDLQTLWKHEFRYWRPNLKNFQFIESIDSTKTTSAVCIALGMIPRDELGSNEYETVRGWLEEKFHDSDDAGIHSASQWALTNMTGNLPKLGPCVKPNWFVNKYGLSFVKVPKPKIGDKENSIIGGEDYFVLSTEVPVGVFAQFEQEVIEDFGTERMFEIDREVSPSAMHPVQSITMEEAIMFCNWLSLKSGKQCCYQDVDGKWNLLPTKDGYRLPTISEMKFFSRAGATTDFYFGSEASFAFIRDYASCIYSDITPSDLETRPVASFIPNVFGLFDTVGNVSEWCWNGLYTSLENHPHPHFGGSFFSSIEPLRGKKRQRANPFTKSSGIGFRVITNSLPKALSASSNSSASE